MPAQSVPASPPANPASTVMVNSMRKTGLPLVPGTGSGSEGW
jgi:hypothetical protein